MKSNLTREMYENAYRKAWEGLRVKERKDQREKEIVTSQAMLWLRTLQKINR